jgi:glycosyltransferase involved in cell wall biosynthesis
MSTTISIIVPAYQEEDNIGSLVTEIKKVLAVEKEWEIILVDDGSNDRTWERISFLHDKDSRVKGLRLTRNFGHQHALYAGLSFANGDAVVTMDADLQHPPAVISELLKAWRSGYKIVNTMRIDRANIPWVKRVTSKMFYAVFSFLSGVKLSAGMADFRLLDRQVVDKLLDLGEYHLFLRGMVQWMGYSSDTITYSSGQRLSGNSRYNLGKMIKLAWTGITSYSIVPLRLATTVGIITSIFAFGGLFYALYAKFVISDVVAGWTSLISFLSLLFGVLFIVIGVLGEYIARILEQVRGRPRFIVGESIGVSLPDKTSNNAEKP